MSELAVYPRLFASLVKIEHTLFALPFAYVGAFLAADDVPSAHALVWITVAMVGARSLAMGLNRLIDAEIDARNPRTAGRELPSGLLSRAQVVAFCALSLALFLLAVWQLEPIVRWLWPIPVAGFGVRGSFLGARALHAATVAALAAVGLGLHVGLAYWLGVAAVAALFVYEHSLVRPDDLRRLDAAFFTVNGVISVVFLVFVLVEAA